MSLISRRESFSSSIAAKVSRSSVPPPALGGSTVSTSELARNSSAVSSGVIFPSSARSAATVGVTASTWKSSGRSQKPRNSAAKRADSRIDSA